MNIENLVRESINHGVDSLPQRDPDPDLLSRRTPRSAVIRIALPALAAAAVIAAVSVIAVDQFGSDDTTVAGIGDSATYMTWPNKVHIDERTHKARHAKGETFETSVMTSAGFAYIGLDDYPYLIDRFGAERRVGASTNPENAKDAWTSIAGSADHRYAAWASQVRGELQVSLFDADAGRVVERRSVDCTSLMPRGSRCEYATAVADGVVYLEGGVSKGRPFSVAWDPSLPASEQVYRATDPGTKVTAVAARSIMAAGNGTVYDPSGQPLGDDWTIVRMEEFVEEGKPSTLSTLTPDGRWYFIVDGEEETTGEDTSYAVDTATGERVELVPNTGGVQIDDDGSVLVMTNGNGGTDLDILDCALPSGECTTAVEDIDRNDALIGEG